MTTRRAKLWPGAFVNVSLQADSLRDALVVPATAVIQTQRGTIVYNEEQGKAALKPVQVLSLQGDIAAVSGIQDGDRVVVEGRQNLRPDSAVVEREASKLAMERKRASHGTISELFIRRPVMTVLLNPGHRGGRGGWLP
ncbi:MAG: hypothetical protein U5O12_15320 [Rhodoferax sp.]|nr:hypothetical protein [Rhodoferax sp.]MDZ7921335.1 hypothetical protein [Rhodoferax sp.]